MAIGEHSPEYKAVIRSPRWKQFRQEVIAYRAFRCQDCLSLGSEYSLQVHHLHYRTLGHEGPNDVLVLCQPCHEKADRERAREVKEEQAIRFADARLNGWATKVYGNDWQVSPGYEYAAEKFDDWIENREGRDDE